MRNVRIEATGAESLSIDVTLGSKVRKTWPVEAGASIDLTVEGNQKLLISAVALATDAEVPAATLEQGADVSPDLPTEAEDFDVNTDDTDAVPDPATDEEVVGGVIDDRESDVPVAEEIGDDHGFFDIPESEDEKPRVSEDAEGNTLVPGVDVFPEDGQPVPPLDDAETVTIGPEDVGSIDVFDLPADAAIQIEQPFQDDNPAGA